MTDKIGEKTSAALIPFARQQAAGIVRHREWEQQWTAAGLSDKAVFSQGCDQYLLLLCVKS